MKSSPEIYSPARSALDDYPGGSVPAEPTVAVIIPVYNERDHSAAIVDAMLGQDYPALREIWFVDGHSEDGTLDELHRLAGHDPRVRMIDNPRRVQSAAINLAISLSTADIVIRIDAHARYASDVVRRSVDALLASGAGGVGAIARPVPADTVIGQSIVAAHQSKLGVGVASFRRESAAGWVDTIWNGCYWRYIVERVGGLREDLPRNEDNDFNARVRALGYGLYLEPAIRAQYVPRRTLSGLWRQYFATGEGVGQTFVESRQSISARHLAPLAFVCGLLVLALGALRGPRFFKWGLVSALGSYSGAVSIAGMAAWRAKPGHYAALLPVVFVTLHVAYGVGTLVGLLHAFAHSDRKAIS